MKYTLYLVLQRQESQKYLYRGEKMKGYPKRFNTKQDVDVAIRVDAEKTKGKLQKMLDERWQWMIIGQLAEADVGVEDSTHKVVTLYDDDGTTFKEKHQYELQEDPECALFRLGYTVAEAQDIIGGA